MACPHFSLLCRLSTAKTKYFTQLIKMPNVYYINLQNFNDNSGFLDSAHPNPTYAKILSIALVHRLKSIIIE